MLNKIDLMGRFVKTPELKRTTNDKAVVSFTIAVDRDIVGNEKQTDFIACTAWNKTAEFISKYFDKGSLAVVSGRLQSRQWEDKNGEKRTSWEVIVSNIYFGGAKSDSNGKAAPEQQTAPESTWDDVEDGDLPF